MILRPTFRSMRFLPGLALALSLLLSNFTTAAAALRCYVKADAAGANTGASWGDAYTSLQSALGNGACTEIWVAAGTYKPTGTTDRSISFALKSGVAIYGGFAGTETLLTQRSPKANATILSGEIGAAGAADNSYHVVVGSGTNNTAILDGFTITAGNGNGSSFNGNAGGMFNDSGSPTLANLAFTANSSGDGGAMKNVSSSPVLINVTFSGNSAGGGAGGGMGNVQSSPSLTNVTFNGNSAGYGGGMSNYFNSSPTLVNVTFSGNTATSGGGGIYNDDNVNATLTNVTFNGNAGGSPDGGGALLISASTLTIKNSILYGDTGTSGEISFFNAGNATISYSIVQGGYAGTGNLNVNPQLNALGDYGGFTQTMTLKSGSPAIDAGTNTGCSSKDQRGMPRPQDGDQNGSQICDMGSTELRFVSGTCYVDGSAVGGFNDGASWADAFINLQSALGASACTEIWAARGTYKPTATSNRSISFALVNGVAIYGGFAGTESVLSERNPAANPTILSGNIGAAGNADNSYHVVMGSGTDATARLDGFTITAGNANAGSWPNNAGGGIYTAGGSPTLANLNISGNSAAGSGGGMASQNSSPTLTGITFSGNTAAGGGGGMYNYSGSDPSVTNVTFTGNSAPAAGGGAILNSGSSPILTNVTFSGNSAGSGGALRNTGGSHPVIKNSILFGDTGGEISNSSSTAAVTYSLVQGGYAGTGNLNANPMLKPLGDYGGFTKTRPPNYGSPAIDHGTSTGCPADDQRGVLRPQDGDGNTTLICDMGSVEMPTIVLQTKTLRSTGSQDGWVLESSETSGSGGSAFATDPTLIVGDAITRQQARGILSFDTSSLPDTAQFISVTLKVKQGAISTTSPFSVLGKLLVDVRKGPFSNNAALQAADFQAPASKLAAMTILNKPVSGWYSAGVPAASYPNINRAGLTQLRLRFSLDDNNDAVSNYIKFYSGNAPTAARPLLIIKYYVP